MSDTTPERNANEGSAANAAPGDAALNSSEATNDEAIELAYEPEVVSERADAAVPARASDDSSAETPRDAQRDGVAQSAPEALSETQAYPPELIEPPVEPYAPSVSEAEIAAAGPNAPTAVVIEAEVIAVDANAAGAAEAVVVTETLATRVAEPVVPAYDPTAFAAAAAAGQFVPSQQPIFVQAPTPPANKGNRGIGILIALLATVAFALVYAGATYLVSLGFNTSLEMTTTSFTLFLGSAVFYVPVIFFFGAFALLIAIVNRGGWWAYVLGAFFVAVVVYFSFIGASLLDVNAWNMTPSEAGRFVADLWLHPIAIIAAVSAREVPIWFGAWIAARGRKVTAKNVAARREYDRVLAEGPSLTRP